LDPPFSNMALISCCNVLIYMSPIIQRKILGLFHYALKPGGFLVLGKAESTTSYPDGFARADRKQPIYSIKHPKENAEFPLIQPTKFEDSPSRLTAPAEFLPAVDLDREADRLVLDRYGPPGFTVGENLKILRFRGNVVPYLDPKR